MTLFLKYTLAGSAAFACSLSVAPAQEYYQSKELDRDSAYESNGNAFFLRAGYAFDSTEEFTIADLNAELAPLGVMVSGNPSDELVNTSAFYSSIGVRQKLKRAGESMISLEGEFLAVREEEKRELTGAFGSAFFQAVGWGLLPNAALRWQYNFDGRVSPYASAGLGPAITLFSFERTINGVGFETKNTDVVFGYTGRTGLEFAITPSFGIEAGYRYLGATDDVAVGFHAGELGLNFKF